MSSAAALTEKPFVSLETAYLGTRSRERKAEEKADPTLARRLDRVDRKEIHSVPGQIDTFEESRLKDIGSVEDQRMAIESYQDARQKLDARNRRLSIASIGAGFAGSAAAIGASLLTNGGLIALGASVAIGVVGEVANRVLQRKMRDPRSIEHMKEFHPKAAAMFEKLDRPTVSRAHWLDRVVRLLLRRTQYLILLAVEE
ncbi:MAG: hypothetical protein AAFY60_04150, partial [Myxococcota bacterium]